jgi:outer membrane protein
MLRSFASRSTFLPALFVCAASVLSPSLAFGQAKVGIINLQRAILETAEIKKASAEMQERFKPKQDALEKIQRELADIQSKLQNPQTPPAQQADLQATGARRQREAQRIQEDLQADVERDRNEILQRAAQRMTDVVRKMADEKGLDLVLDTSNSVYFKPALEITEEAIAAYDKAYPVK